VAYLGLQPRLSHDGPAALRWGVRPVFAWAGGCNRLQALLVVAWGDAVGAELQVNTPSSCLARPVREGNGIGITVVRRRWLRIEWAHNMRNVTPTRSALVVISREMTSGFA